VLGYDLPVLAHPSLPAESQLLAYGRTLWRRKWAIILVTVVATLAAVAFAKLQTPIYQATATLLIQPSASGQAAGASSATVNINDEIQQLEGTPVQALVRERIGAAPPVAATAVLNTDTIVVAATSTDPTRAAKVANAYAQAYIDQRRTEALTGAAAATNDLQSKIGPLQTQINMLQAAGSRSSITSQAQLTSLLQQQSLLEQQITTLQLASALNANSVTIIHPATVPRAPSSPSLLRDALLGLAAGLVLGIALAFLRERLDDTITTKEDVGSAAPGLPVLGLIPDVAAWKDKSKPELASVTHPQSAAAEAYKSLRTSVQFLGLDRPLRSLQVTSPKSSEGKTTTLANLAVALAGAGLRVAVMCCDLRRPRIHKFYGLSNSVGLTSVLLGDIGLSQALQQVPGQERLFLLASGPEPPNPSELLSGQRTVDVLGSLCRLVDLVLVDTPPVLPVTDAVVIAPRVDATVVVISAGVTTARDLSRTLELLAQVKAPVVGAVLNGVLSESRYSYRYEYTSTNGAHTKASPESFPAYGQGREPAARLD